MIKQKGLQDYLAEDPSLSEKITYEEFQRRQNAPAEIKDDGVTEAYESYCKIVQELEEETDVRN